MAIEAHNENCKEHHEALLWAAWHGAVFERVKQIPSLEKVLGRKTAEDDPQKGAQAIKAALLAYSAGHVARTATQQKPVSAH